METLIVMFLGRPDGLFNASSVSPTTSRSHGYIWGRFLYIFGFALPIPTSRGRLDDVHGDVLDDALKTSGIRFIYVFNHVLEFRSGNFKATQQENNTPFDITYILSISLALID